MLLFRVNDGELMSSFGSIGRNPNDIVIDSDGTIYVADRGNNRICVFGAGGGDMKFSWGSKGTADGQFESPATLALSQGKLYVLDINSSRVQVFRV